MSSSALGFHSEIPVVNLNDFFDPAKKKAFVTSVSDALHTIGFFAVTNTGISDGITQRAYAASMAFFTQTQDEKESIYKPELNGQRGYVPGETAQGHAKKDHKEFIHIGKTSNLWPASMDLENPMMELMSSLDRVGIVLQQAFAEAIDEEECFLTKMTAEGDSLLRALHYLPNPERGACWAGQHTDIDLFTLLPPATEQGLQVHHNNEWIPVTVPPGSIIVNGGDMLQNLTNGYFKSSLHRVVANAEKPELERYSIVYFVHARSADDMSPTAKCVTSTGGTARYPKAKVLDLLSSRLRELGLATQFLKDHERESGILDRVKALVDSGNAADLVKLTWELRNQGR